MNGTQHEHDQREMTSMPMAGELAERVERLLSVERPRYRRLWAYCRNPMRIGLVVDETGGAERRTRGSWAIACSLSSSWRSCGRTPRRSRGCRASRTSCSAS